ncbi:hypothetical protein CR513_39164, partial [Mucuna pruriens]
MVLFVQFKKYEDTLQEANALVAASSQEEVTMMWHHRLGHMSKQCLKVLMEHNLLPRIKMVRITRNINGRAKYFVSFIDDYSRRLWVYPIKTKSSVFSQFKEFKAQVELETGRKIKCLRTDNGGEYVDGEFLAFCKQEGIVRQFTILHIPE